MKTIMFYINTIEAGGAQRVMVNLCQQFASHGYDVYLVTSYPVEWEYAFTGEIHRINLENTRITDSFLHRNCRRVLRLRRLCKNINPDILISFMAEPNYRALIATLGLRTKTLISIRNAPDMEYPGKIHKVLAKTLFCLANGCVFQTKEAKEWFPQRIQKKSKIIMNQVDEVFFEGNHIYSDNCIVNIGRLVIQKNQSLLIKAFANIADEFPHCKMEIWGEGDEFGNLNNQIIQLGLEKRVYLRGISDDVPGILDRASIFVLCSNFEGMPNTLLEAMAKGCPVVATDCPCGGPRELLIDGINGYLIPVDDEQELTEKIRTLLLNRSIAEKIGRNAKESANDFRPQTIYTQWEKYINKIINN